MIIHAMTASFGKLQNETLTLKPGLNVIHAPNEWGKSTWCAFLLAMLYGIDTSARASKGVLPDKTRYAPWSGAPMSGRMDITWQGRDITIERSTKGRIPMGQFAAYETQSHLPVPELTAENCGLKLLGVERSVFLRAGFLRFSDLPVTADETLRQRLNALVTTGDESGDAETLSQKLKALKNACRHNTTGQLPQAEGQAAKIQQALQELEGLGRQIDNVKAQQKELCQQEKLLLNHREALAFDASREYRRQLSAAQWRQPFTLSPAGFGANTLSEKAKKEQEEQLALAEEARVFLVGELDGFAARCKDLPASQVCAALYKRMQALGGEEAMGLMCAELKASEGIPAASEAVRVWNLTADLLNQMALLLGDEVLPAAELADLFELLVRSTDLGHIPQTLDQVIFTTAGRMRLDNPDWCFVLGLAEGEFPKAPGDKGLLTHAERESLMRQGVEMPDCFENRAIREQVCFYKALTAPAKGLWLSWAAGSAAMPVTSALAPVIECFTPKEPALERADLAATPAMALDLLGQSWDAESGETAALFQSLAEYRDEAEQGKLLNPVKQAAGAEPFAVHNTAAMKQLLGRELWLTPSRMERYYSCPFAYFLEYVLGAKPRKQAALTADQSGNLVHYILEQALRRAGEGFVDLSEEQVKALAAAIAEEYVEENMPGQARRFGYLVERLKKSAANLLLYIQAEQRQGSFVPVAFEKGIGTSPEDVPPVVLTTSTGETVRMVGKIDRVDAFEKNGNTWLRVVDYKTGSKEFLLEDVKNGLNCQMLVYLFTLTRNGGQQFADPAPAGVLYLMADPAPTRGSRQQASKGLEYKVEGLVADEYAVIDAMDRERKGLFVPFKFDKDGTPKPGPALASLETLDGLRQELDGLVVQMAERLYAGQVAAEPIGHGKRKETNCKYCDYRSVCGHEDD